MARIHQHISKTNSEKQGSSLSPSKTGKSLSAGSFWSSDTVQSKFIGEVKQLKSSSFFPSIQLKKNNSNANQLAIAPKNKTGIPSNIKSGVEQLSGISLDDVKVHYNSSQPAQLHAHAYAQGTDIHVAPGKENYLPHEAWHVVQQKQGRVKPTAQLKGKVPVNDNIGLENEADVMGSKALRIASTSNEKPIQQKSIATGLVAQLGKFGSAIGGVKSLLGIGEKEKEKEAAELGDLESLYPNEFGADQFVGVNESESLTGQLGEPSKGFNENRLGEGSKGFKSANGSTINPTELFHTTSNGGAKKSIEENGINPKYTSKENRFGQGFYATTDIATSRKELVHHDMEAHHTLKYDTGKVKKDRKDAEKGRIIDLTQDKTDESFIKDYPQGIKKYATEKKYDGVAFPSQRGEGVNFAMYNNFDSTVGKQKKGDTKAWTEDERAAMGIDIKRKKDDFAL